MRGHDHPRPATNRGQRTHADQPAYLGGIHAEKPRVSRIDKTPDEPVSGIAVLMTDVIL
jgi:hypothetical protein